MTEYIEREAVFEWFCNFVDDDGCVDMPKNNGNCRKGYRDCVCGKELDAIPAADVVEVVRCKDCDLWNEWDESGHEQTGNYVCSCAYFSNEDGYTVYTGPDDYCSRGERKEVQG